MWPVTDSCAAAKLRANYSVSVDKHGDLERADGHWTVVCGVKDKNTRQMRRALYQACCLLSLRV